MPNIQLNEEWSQYFYAWLLDAAAAGLKGAGENCDWYLFESDTAKHLLKQRVLTYRCLPARSAFTRAFSELKAEGLPKVRQPMSAEPDEPIVTPESYARTDAATVRRRYAQEPAYRAAIDHLLATGQI